MDLSRASLSKHSVQSCIELPATTSSELFSVSHIVVSKTSFLPVHEFWGEKKKKVSRTANITVTIFLPLREQVHGTVLYSNSAKLNQEEACPT